MIAAISISVETQPLSAAIPSSAARSTQASPPSEDRFNQVVLPYLAEAYALARWLTGSHADAHDVVQESCIRALRAIGAAPIRSARGWIMTIVRHAANDWMGKNSAPV
jgi:DNA-directed RNA polymerase specialized sigma24 family protein